MENRSTGHHKSYTVLIADNGVVVTAWGRIGTAGQSKIIKVPNPPDAEAVGKRQVYSKQTGGYSVVHNEFKFTVEQEVLDEACRRDMTTHLTRAFFSAVTDPQFAGGRQAVMKHYDDFVNQAQRLLNGASERAFDEVYAEFEQLEEAWAAISDKHAEAEVTISLAKQTLSQRLMSGAL